MKKVLMKKILMNKILMKKILMKKIKYRMCLFLHLKHFEWYWVTDKILTFFAIYKNDNEILSKNIYKNNIIKRKAQKRSTWMRSKTQRKILKRSTWKISKSSWRRKKREKRPEEDIKIFLKNRSISYLIIWEIII